MSDSGHNTPLVGLGTGPGPQKDGSGGMVVIGCLSIARQWIFYDLSVHCSMKQVPFLFGGGRLDSMIDTLSRQELEVVVRIHSWQPGMILISRLVIILALSSSDFVSIVAT